MNTHQIKKEMLKEFENLLESEEEDPIFGPELMLGVRLLVDFLQKSTSGPVTPELEYKTLQGLMKIVDSLALEEITKNRTRLWVLDD